MPRHRDTGVADAVGCAHGNRSDRTSIVLTDGSNVSIDHTYDDTNVPIDGTNVPYDGVGSDRYSRARHYLAGEWMHCVPGCHAD